MRTLENIFLTLSFIALTACGGTATTVNGNATGGDGVGGGISSTVDVSGNCIATNKECPGSS